MGGLIFVVVGFVLVMSVQIALEKYYFRDKFLEYSIICVLIGTLAVVGTKYFDLPVIGLAYRVKPEIVHPTSAIYTGFFLVGAGILGILLHLLMSRRSSKPPKKDKKE